MSDRRDFVLEAPLGRAIWSLAWPIALSNQLSVLTGGVMLFWLARLVGETGLVVDSLFRPFGFLVAWCFGSTSVGAGVLVSRSVGARDGRGLSIAAGTVTLCAWVCLGFIAVVVPISSWLASLLSSGLPVEHSMLRFLIAWAVVAIPGLTIGEVLLDVANSTGATKYNLVRVLLDLAVMAALTPILINVVGLGIAGGPVSEGVATLSLSVLLWFALNRGRNKLGLGELGAGAWKIRWGLWKEVLAIGVPVQVGRVVMFGSQMILVQRLARDGEAGVAGYGIASAILLIGMMMTLAVAQSGSILIGQSLGAGLRDRARRAIRAALLVGWSVMALFIAATALDRPIVGLFTSDPAIMEAARHALSILRWAGLGVATWQILLSCFSAHQATVRASLLMIAGEMFGLAVAFSWPGSYLDAVCVALVAANGLKGALLLGLLATGKITRAPAAAVVPPAAPH